MLSTALENLTTAVESVEAELAKAEDTAGAETEISALTDRLNAAVAAHATPATPPA